MLSNPIYGGSLYWNRTQWLKIEDTGKRLRKHRAKGELRGAAGNAPQLAIVKPATWKLVQLQLSVKKGTNTDVRLKSGGRAVYLLSGLLRCSECHAHYVLDSATHYACGSVKDGKACNNTIRVRRDVAERVILTPITDELLAPEVINEMAAEMRRYHAELMAEAQSETAKRPTAVLELDSRIARLRDRLKGGDPDMTPDDLLAVIERAEVKREELLSLQPEAKRHDKILHGLPRAAQQYRDQITKGLTGDPKEAGLARIAVRQLLGNEITLKPAKGGKHLVAHLQFHRAALLGESRFGGSGGRISHTPTRSSGLRINTL
jgi:hypothetical protein